MYAIIDNGGRQCKVTSGDTIDVDLREVPEGTDKIEFGRVFMIGSGSDSQIGTPLVEGAKVIATVQGQVKDAKIHVTHFIRRKGHHTKVGHRQRYLRVRIEEIVA